MLADALGGSLIFPPSSKMDSLLARVERRTATDIRQAFAAVKQRRTVSTFVSLSEKIGIPLALLLPKQRVHRPAHILVAHHLTSTNKRILQEKTWYLNRFDRIVVLSRPQWLYLVDEADYPRSRAMLLHDAVDHRFWQPSLPPTTGGYVLAVGRERRDYHSLSKALRELPHVSAIIVASSPWSRQSKNLLLVEETAANITVQSNMLHSALRDLYARASLVVVPLEAGTNYAAGANALLEAMSMAKPVLVTATPGLADYFQNDDAEVVARVPDGDPVHALRTSIETLLGTPDRCAELAPAGRRFVEQVANIDRYVARMAEVVNTLLQG